MNILILKFHVFLLLAEEIKSWVFLKWGSVEIIIVILRHIGVRPIRHPPKPNIPEFGNSI